jgi:hypothetical protein
VASGGLYARRLVASGGLYARRLFRRDKPGGSPCQTILRQGSARTAINSPSRHQDFLI